MCTPPDKYGLYLDCQREGGGGVDRKHQKKFYTLSHFLHQIRSNVICLCDTWGMYMYLHTCINYIYTVGQVLNV